MEQKENLQSVIPELFLQNHSCRTRYGLDMLLPGVYRADRRAVSEQLLQYAGDNEEELLSFLDNLADGPHGKERAELRFETAFALRLLPLPEHGAAAIGRWLRLEKEDYILRELLCLVGEQGYKSLENDLIRILSGAVSYQLLFASVHAISLTGGESGLLALGWLKALYTEFPQKQVRFASAGLGEQIVKEAAAAARVLLERTSITHARLEKLEYHFTYLWDRHKRTFPEDDRASWNHIIGYIDKKSGDNIDEQTTTCSQNLGIGKPDAFQNRSERVQGLHPRFYFL